MKGLSLGENDEREAVSGDQCVPVEEPRPARDIRHASRRAEAEWSPGVPLLRSFAERPSRLSRHLFFRSCNEMQKF